MRGWLGALGLVTLALAVIGLSIGIGFAGAPHDERYDWALSAEVGTAFGTILLAVYTALLARTTSREVGVAVEEQRARERPIIVVTPQELTSAVLDTEVNKTVPTLMVEMINVGLGPALK